jgi:glycosyltransferase involved in cell wall biosynthesis
MAEGLRRRWRIIHSESEIGWGGQEHRILTELTGFQRRGCEVGLYAKRDADLYKRASGLGIDVHPYNVAKWRFPITVLETARWLRRQRPDILNTHSSRDGWMVGLAGRLARVPLIVRSRHFDVRIPNRWLSRHAYATLADHVVTTSRSITERFQKHFHLPLDRITTGIDVEVFHPVGSKADLWPDGIHPEWPLVGMVSVLRNNKGHETFLRAARLLRDSRFFARFVVVGEGTSRPVIERQAAELQVEEYVRLLGFRGDVPAVMRSLDLVVIPSLHEGVPQVGLQALACQTPVIGSKVGGIPEIIRHGETGRLFPPGDAAALAKTIREAIEEHEATRTMSLAGRALVVAHHSVEVMLDKLEAIYRRYLSA